MKSEEKSPRWLVNTLESMGKETFIKYFEFFDFYAYSPSNIEIIDAFKNEKWSNNSKDTKASCGKRIFLNNQVKNALEIVGNSNIGQQSIEKAERLLKLYRNGNSSYHCSITISNQTIKETARKIIMWAMDYQPLAEAITKHLVPRDNKSNNSNVAGDYKFPELGTGSFLIVFKEKPSKEELMSGDVQRYFDETLETIFFNERLNNNYWYYLSNQWTNEKSFLSLRELITFIKAHSPSSINIESSIERKSVSFAAYDNDEEFLLGDKASEELIVDEQCYGKEEVRKVEHDINAKIESYKKKRVNKTPRLLNIKKLKSKFRGSLLSQNRAYADKERCFFPGLLLRLLPNDYSDLISVQVDSVFAYTENDNKVNLSEFKKLYIREDGLFATKTHYKEDLVKLYFKVADKYHSFAEYIQYPKDISLEHIKPMTELLKPDKGSNLRIISDIYYANQHLDPKTTEGLDALVQLLEGKINADQLIKELKALHESMEVTILPTQINTAKGGR